VLPTHAPTVIRLDSGPVIDISEEDEDGLTEPAGDASSIPEEVATLAEGPGGEASAKGSTRSSAAASSRASAKKSATTTAATSATASAAPTPLPDDDEAPSVEDDVGKGKKSCCVIL
jgi:cell division septation protein DedD